MLYPVGHQDSLWFSLGGGGSFSPSGVSTTQNLSSSNDVTVFPPHHSSKLEGFHLHDVTSCKGGQVTSLLTVVFGVLLPVRPYISWSVYGVLE